MKQIATFILKRLMGWKISGNVPELKKYILIVVPHTSWHDFYLGVLVRRALGLQINYVGKKELFRPTFGWFFKWTGGAPLDRTSGQHKVSAIAGLFHENEEFRLALAPEGTRKKVTEWKTGFYYIAKEAGVPIVMVAFDFGKKEVKIAVPFYPTEDKDADFKFMYAFYKGVVGKVPEFSFEA